MSAFLHCFYFILKQCKIALIISQPPSCLIHIYIMALATMVVSYLPFKMYCVPS